MAKPVDTRIGGNVELHGVSKYIVEEEQLERQPLIDNCTLQVKNGEFTVIVGPSGCGKTTLISLIAGYFPVDEGRITLDGEPITGPGWDRLTVFQETSLFPWLTTLGNVMFGPRIRKEEDHASAKAKALEMLRQFGLSDFADRYPSQLSGGMQRRAELARALINKPKMLLMDEPFRGLDAMTREMMQEYIIRLFEETGQTILFVTSEVDEAVLLADRIIVLTSLPASVKDEVEVDLGRPRTLEMRTDDKFVKIKGLVLEMVYEEARKGFSDDMGALVDLEEALERNRKEHT